MSARELHYTPGKACQVLNVCCTLHNICLDFKVETPNIERDNENESSQPCNINNDEDNLNYSNLAKNIRNTIRNNLQRNQ